MGADLYWYYVPYEDDKDSALQKLRQREFEAGRYRPVLYDDFFIDDPSKSPSPGRQHDTIEEILEETEEEGTGSILDLVKTTEKGYGYSVAYILNEKELRNFFGDEKPTREKVHENLDKLWDDIAKKHGVRGVGVCIPIYKDGTPTELFFMGFSYD